jgi:hypothetical protein
MKIIGEKGTREGTVGFGQRVNLRTYSLDVDPQNYKDIKDVKLDVCGLCHLGSCKKTGYYFRSEDEKECRKCADEMSKKHQEALKTGKGYTLDVETTRTIVPVSKLVPSEPVFLIGREKFEF